MVKISDHQRSIVHDFFKLYVKREDGTLECVCDGDFIDIQLFIDFELSGASYVIERFTASQYIPKERRFKFDGN